jgi:hypothetical protein
MRFHKIAQRLGRAGSGSAPLRTDRSTVDPAQTPTPEAWDRARTGTVPVFTYNSLDEGGAQLCPCGIATITPQHFIVASRANIHMLTREFPTRPTPVMGAHRTRPMSTRLEPVSP